MITRGEMMRLMNEPYKLGVCRLCSKPNRRVRKDNGLCERCMYKAAPIVNGLLLGYHPPKSKEPIADASA